MTDEYKTWIDTVKNTIKQSQIKASVKINYELIDLCWNLGKEIVEKKVSAKWGDTFLAVMSKDLQRTFSRVSGF